MTNNLQVLRAELSALPSMADHLAMTMVKVKDELLYEIMKQVLGRDGTKQDALMFKFINHQQYPGREFIGYNGISIGEIIPFEKEEDFQWRYGFTFVPKSTFDQ